MSLDDEANITSSPANRIARGVPSRIGKIKKRDPGCACRWAFNLKETTIRPIIAKKHRRRRLGGGVSLTGFEAFRLRKSSTRTELLVSNISDLDLAHMFDSDDDDDVTGVL